MKREMKCCVKTIKETYKACKTLNHYINAGIDPEIVNECFGEDLWENYTNYEQEGVMGHDLLDAKHIKDNPEMYNNRGYFDKNSEYTAYKFQRDKAAAAGDATTATVCKGYKDVFVTQGAVTV